MCCCSLAATHPLTHPLAVMRLAHAHSDLSIASMQVVLEVEGVLKYERLQRYLVETLA